MDVQIGDHVVINNNNGHEMLKVIESPKDLRDLNNLVSIDGGYQLTQIQLYKGRDLRPSLISYNRNG